MVPDVNPELIKEIDPQEAQLAIENKKIDDFYEKHPEKKPTQGKGVPVKEIDPEFTKLAIQIEKMNQKSLQKKNATKKKIKRSIVAVALTTTAAITAIGVLSPFIDKTVGHFRREHDLNLAVAYMDDNFMPAIYEEAGFIKIGTDDKGRVKYQYDGTALLNAESILVSRFGFKKDPARLLLQKSLGGAYSDKTLKSDGYQTGEDFDVTYGFIKPNDTFENMNEVSVANHVNEIKIAVEQGKSFNDYTVTEGSTYTINEEEGVSR